MNDPETQEAAVLQALMARAAEGQAEMSERQIAKVTGLSRSCVQRTVVRLTNSGQLSAMKNSGTGNPTLWEIPAQRVARGVAHDRETVDGNAVPTMPFNYPLPSGEEGSWFRRLFQQITHAHIAVKQGRLSPVCYRCADVGYIVEKTTPEYSRSWVRVCSCETGQYRVIPDVAEYVPERSKGDCLMCGNSGWVSVAPLVASQTTYEQVQRCYSCRKTWS